MNEEHEPNADEEVERFARWAVPRIPEPRQDRHPREALFVALATNTLLPEERRELIKHLANCHDCRERAHLLLSDDSKEDSPVSITLPEEKAERGSRRQWASQTGWSLALAASLLIALGMGVWWYRAHDSSAERLARAEIYWRAEKYEEALATIEPILETDQDPALNGRARALALQVAEIRGEQLLGQREFAAVRSLHDRMNELGVRSSRLDTLTAQSWLNSHTLVAMASYGSLTDLGYLPGSAALPTVTKAFEPHMDTVLAGRLLSAAIQESPEDRVARIDYGHWLLRQNKPAEAAEQFNKLLVDNPRDRDALAGRGMAAYIAERFTDAASDFRRVLQSGPATGWIHLNLAMALDRQFQESAGQKSATELRDQAIQQYAAAIATNEEQHKLIEARLQFLNMPR